MRPGHYHHSTPKCKLMDKTKGDDVVVNPLHVSCPDCIAAIVKEKVMTEQ